VNLPRASRAVVWQDRIARGRVRRVHLLRCPPVSCTQCYSAGGLREWVSMCVRRTCPPCVPLPQESLAFPTVTVDRVTRTMRAVCGNGMCELGERCPSEGAIGASCCIADCPVRLGCTCARCAQREASAVAWAALAPPPPSIFEPTLAGALCSVSLRWCSMPRRQRSHLQRRWSVHHRLLWFGRVPVLCWLHWRGL
jgi:hypothetical protein